MMDIDSDVLISALSRFAAITKQVVPDNCQENLINTITRLSQAVENLKTTPDTIEISLQECSMVLSASVDLTVKSSNKLSEKKRLDFFQWITIAAFILQIIQTLISAFPPDKSNPKMDILIHQQQAIIHRLEKQCNEESRSNEMLSNEIVDIRENFTEFKEDFLEFSEDFRNLSERVIDSLDLIGDTRHDGDDFVDIVDDTTDNKIHPEREDEKPNNENQEIDN